jgi:hypothetical protein
MLTFMMHKRTAWNDYFTGSPTSTFSNEYRNRQTPSVTNVYFLNSLFISITSSSSGGALYCNPVSCLLVESTFFFSCKTNGYSGGAIYFSNTGSGQCVFNKLCVYDCCTTSSYSGQFSYIDVKNDATSKCYSNYSSFVRCINSNSGSHYTLAHWYGKHCYTSINVSNNKCYGRCGILCCPFVDSNSVTSLLSYSTFTDNIATEYTCICIWSTGTKHEIKSCNILRNTQGTLGTEGTIATWGTMMIEDSCILENKATNIFYVSSSSYTITLSNCTVDSTSNNGCLTTRNTVTKNFILALNHISTRNCHSEYDSAGTLTPNIQTPYSSKKQRLYCSCDCLLNWHQQGNITSFASILVFNFINPRSFDGPLY